MLERVSDLKRPKEEEKGWGGGPGWGTSPAWLRETPFRGGARLAGSAYAIGGQRGGSRSTEGGKQETRRGEAAIDAINTKSTRPLAASF